VRLLCEVEYPGNIRALRNLIFELTSYVNETTQSRLSLFSLFLPS
jgi:DNA-binding NtrC family response regulator